MRLMLSIILVILTAVAGQAKTNRLLRTTAELRGVLAENRSVGIPFALEGVVEQPPASRYAGFTLVDDSGAVCLYRGLRTARQTMQPGDRISISGETAFYDKGRQHIYARCDKLDVSSHGSPPSVRETRCADLWSGAFDFRRVTVSGTVRNAFRDEIDPAFVILILSDGTATVPVIIRTQASSAELDAYIGAEVRATCLCNPHAHGTRLHLGRYLGLHSLADITLLHNTEHDAFDVPDLSILQSKSTRDIIAAGRHKAFGRVVTRWDEGRRLILETAGGTFVNVEQKNSRPPAVGETVEVSGTPETDLFRLHLNHAAWRPAHGTVPSPRKPEEVAVPEIFGGTNGLSQIQARLHGHPLTVCGTVRNSLDSHTGERHILLEGGGHSIPVDVSVCSGSQVPDVGATVRLTGTCVIDSELQGLASSFPRIRDVFLVVNRPSDITLLAAAPYWTSARLGTVIGALVAILLGILLWNISLRLHVRRKALELEREIANSVETELRFHERTRLATELHDSISQNLTGVALALDEVDEALEPGNETARARLDIAAMTLKSCRRELRNCLWDLRNEALDEPSVDSAIRRTLAPHVRDTKLAIRFSVAREIFSDHTLHTILCIIRELTVNAIRHGNASSVRIAGSLEDGELRFSVSDDGTGFDPGSRAGIETGHFGLQGVQERTESLGGNMIVRSQPGKGAKITISIRLDTPSSPAEALCQR